MERVGAGASNGLYFAKRLKAFMELDLVYLDVSFIPVVLTYCRDETPFSTCSIKQDIKVADSKVQQNEMFVKSTS